MTNFCMNCRVLVAEDKRFCARCGQPLALAAEAEAKLRREVEAAPGKVGSLEQLISLLAADGTREADLAELRVQWCEVLVAKHPREEELDTIRNEFRDIPFEVLPPATMRRAADCLVRLYADDPASEKLAEAAAKFSRATHGVLTGAGKDAWVRACLGWGDARKDYHRRWSRTFYEYASAAEPENLEVAARLRQVRELEQRTRVRTIAIGAIGIVLIGVAGLTFRHFMTSTLIVTLPASFHDASVSASEDDRGRLLTLETKRPGIFRGETNPGDYAIRIFKDGFQLWDSTVTLVGGHRTLVALPGLMENGPLGERPLGDADFSRFRAAPDPLAAYVGFVWAREGKSLSRLPQLDLPVPSGTAQVFGFTKIDPTDRMNPQSAWFLRTPEGDTFFLRDLKGGVKGHEMVVREGRPALMIKTEDPHDVGGFDASTWIFHDGQAYRYHSVTQVYGDDVSPPPETADGVLGMSLFRELGKTHE